MLLSATEWDAQPGEEYLHQGRNCPNEGRVLIPDTKTSEAEIRDRLKARHISARFSFL